MTGFASVMGLAVAALGAVPAPAAAQDHPAPPAPAHNPPVIVAMPASKAHAGDKSPTVAPVGPMALHLTFAIASDDTASNCKVTAVGLPGKASDLCGMLPGLPADVRHYLRAGAPGAVTIGVDFTYSLDGGPPLPSFSPKPGIAIFLRVDVDAMLDSNGLGTTCVLDSGWGPYKLRAEAPCPHNIHFAAGPAGRHAHVLFTLSSTGPVPDAAALVKFIAAAKAKHRVGSTQVMPAAPPTPPTDKPLPPTAAPPTPHP